LRPSLLAVVTHHAAMTNAGADPTSLLRHAYRLRSSLAADREAENGALWSPSLKPRIRPSLPCKAA
jgi:hypothetical protein